MTFVPTDQERAILNALRRLYPREAVHPLDGSADVQWREAGGRLLNAGVIDRVERSDFDPNSGEPVDIACYRLHSEFVTDDLGGTPSPQDN